MNANPYVNGAADSGATWEVSDNSGSFSMGSAPVSHTFQGGTPLYTVGGYSATAASVNPVSTNAQQVSDPATGGVSLTDTSAEIIPDTSTVSASNNVFSNAWETADANSRVIIILMVVGVILQLAGK